MGGGSSQPSNPFKQGGGNQGFGGGFGMDRKDPYDLGNQDSGQKEFEDLFSLGS